VRVLVAHGAVDLLSPNRDDPASISVADAEKAIAEGRFHYLALGDRHSLTRVGASGRIWYSGTSEAYDFDEVQSGHIVVVEVGPEGAVATPHRVGVWMFLEEHADVATDDDIEALMRRLDSHGDKERTVVKLRLAGTLTIRQRARLDQILDHAQDLFAAVFHAESGSGITVVADDSDFADLSLAGFAATAVALLRETATAPGPESATARDALALLVRLAGSRT
jgi:DNA repair exonuclease SbcCD nuclease subunit